MFSILVVDDEKSVRKTIAMQLEEAGYDTSSAATAEEAIQLLMEHPVDLVISDIMLPGERGDKLLEKINHAHPMTKTIFISGHADTDSAIKGLRAGALDFLPKPVDKNTLLNSIHKAQDILELAKSTGLLQDRNHKLHDLLEEKIQEKTGELFSKTEQILKFQKWKQQEIKTFYIENIIKPMDQLLETLRSEKESALLSDLDQAAVQLRSIYSELETPDTNHQSGCMDLLERLLFRMQQQTDAVIEQKLNCGEAHGLSNQQLIQLYYFVEEALRNAVKHSGADLISVTTEKSRDEFKITVDDNGNGFNINILKKRQHNTGLLMLEKRAEMAGGELLIETEAGMGTSASLTIKFK